MIAYTKRKFNVGLSGKLIFMTSARLNKLNPYLQFF